MIGIYPLTSLYNSRDHMPSYDSINHKLQRILRQITYHKHNIIRNDFLSCTYDSLYTQGSASFHYTSNHRGHIHNYNHALFCSST